MKGRTPMKGKNSSHTGDGLLQAFLAAALGFPEMAIEKPGSENL